MQTEPIAVLPPLPGGLVFFGDSLTDPGNLYALTEGLVDEDIRANAGGPNGEASDGPTQASYTVELLGATGSENYAIAGAEAAGTQTLGDFVIESEGAAVLIVPPDDPRLTYDINLGAQVDRYLADHAGQDLSQETGVILIGANDYLAIEGATLRELLEAAALAQTAAVAATLAAADALLASGLGAVVIYGLPGASFFPVLGAGSAAEQALAETLFADHNAKLAEGAAAMQAAGQDVRVLALTPITDALTEDAASFGFIAPQDLTLTFGDPATVALYDADQVMFWDPLHPTTAAHGVIGAYAAFALENEAVVLGAGDDLVQTGAEADLVFAYGGADSVQGFAGNDSVFGGSGADGARGRAGFDQVSGGSDDDWLSGGAGNDVLAGVAGDDLLRTGQGQDVLIDGLGSDTLKAGAGADVLIFIEPALIGGSAGAADLFYGGDGVDDTLYLVLGPEAVAAAAGQSTANVLSALGITAYDIEQVVIVEGRAGLDALAGSEWFASADLWGLL